MDSCMDFVVILKDYYCSTFTACLTEANMAFWLTRLS